MTRQIVALPFMALFIILFACNYKYPEQKKLERRKKVLELELKKIKLKLDSVQKEIDSLEIIFEE